MKQKRVMGKVVGYEREESDGMFWEVLNCGHSELVFWRDVAQKRTQRRKCKKCPRDKQGFIIEPEKEVN